MTVTEFEPDPNYGAAAGPFGMNLEGGIVNVQPAEKFDDRVSTEVEGLLYLGYLTQDFTLYGHSFTIRTLRRAERLAIAQLVREWEGTIGLADALQTAHVAASVVLVDGRPLSIPVGPTEERDPITWIRRNFGLVGQWYDPLLEGVYDQYSLLRDRQVQAFLEFEGK